MNNYFKRKDADILPSFRDIHIFKDWEMQIIADFYCHLAFEIRFTKQRISLKKLTDSGRFLYEIVSVVYILR